MNNEQFRKLVATNSKDPKDGYAKSSKSSAAPRSILGSRQKSSFSMTPRSLAGKTSYDFGAKSGKNDSTKSQQKAPKVSVPKGSKLAAGYVDRSKSRREAVDETDEIAERIQALETQMKEGEIDLETFEQMRNEITGGDISRTHLVKGLDRKLLERIRRGEDVMTETKESKSSEPDLSAGLDDEFGELEEQEVVAQAREEKVKEGEKAIHAPVAGQKRTRDQILAEMKAQRERIKAAARPQLGAGFKKIGKDPEARIEKDAKGREILITTDEHGNVKRKIRKVNPVIEYESPVISKTSELLQEPLGADINVPLVPALPEEDSDSDIFEGVGHTFNPLADLDGDDSSEDGIDDADGGSKAPRAAESSGSENDDHNDANDNIPRTRSVDTNAELSRIPHATRKNYFNEDPASFSVLRNVKNDMGDPSVLAALAASRRIDLSKTSDDQNDVPDAEEEAKRRRKEAMISNRDRDLEDMDMGFGASRFDDQEEMSMEGSNMKLSKWKSGAGDDEDDEEGRGGRGDVGKRKRGAKKRKGDKNSAADVMRVLQGNKSNKS